MTGRGGVDEKGREPKGGDATSKPAASNIPPPRLSRRCVSSGVKSSSMLRRHDTVPKDIGFALQIWNLGPSQDAKKLKVREL